MSDVNYVKNWADENTQCQNCRQFREENGMKACVPEGELFAEAVEKYGEVDSTGHCDYFTPAK